VESEQDLRERAEDGDSTAQYDLAWLIVSDEKRQGEHEEGFNWAKKAAESNIKAKFLVARCQYAGVGCEQDKIKAVKLAEDVLILQQKSGHVVKPQGHIVHYGIHIQQGITNHYWNGAVCGCNMLQYS